MSIFEADDAGCLVESVRVDDVRGCVAGEEAAGDEPAAWPPVKSEEQTWGEYLAEYRSHAKLQAKLKAFEERGKQKEAVERQNARCARGRTESAHHTRVDRPRFKSLAPFPASSPRLAAHRSSPIFETSIPAMSPSRFRQASWRSISRNQR